MRHSLKVFALVTEAYGGRGGIACAARDVLQSLSLDPRIDKIFVLPRTTVDKVDVLPAKVHQGKAISNRLAYAVNAVVSLRHGFDVVFCNHVYMAPLAALAAKLAGARLVIQVHGIEVWGRLSGLRRWALEQADYVVCVSRDTRMRILSQCDISPESLVVIPNTVSEAFKPRDRKVAREKFGLTDELVLLAVGRLSAQERYKGHDRVIDALPQVLRNHPNATFLIAGDGDDRARLEASAQVRTLGTDVRFLGQVPQSSLNDLYNAADLFILPSTGEGFGIVFLEAMAAGTPAMGLAIAGAKDALADGALGVCVDEAGFPAALDQALGKPKISGKALSDAVHQRFGKPVFNVAISHLVSRLTA
jgi:phosphatidylinositol alpha-1,6-mannosyltransferase